MSTPKRGTRHRLSVGRTLIADNLYHAAKVPAVSVTKPIRMPALALARKAAVPSPSWTAVFMRAYGLVAQKYPELRRAWVPFPFPHLYQHPHSVCALIIERELAGEQILLGAHVRAPELMTLPDIDARMRWLKETPFERIGDFRRLLRLGRLPRFMRRMIAWWHLSVSGYRRCRVLGTFMMSSIGSLGTDAVNPPCLLTTLLTLGAISPTGDTVLHLTFDHRITDGRPIGRALNDLEEVLNTTMVEELRGLASRAA